MAIAIAPAAAGATAALFLAEPTFNAMHGLTDAWLTVRPSPKSSIRKQTAVSSWAHTLLSGASFGFGAATLAATMSPSIAMLPALGIGTAAGALLWAAWRAISGGVKVLHNKAKTSSKWYAGFVEGVNNVKRTVADWIPVPIRVGFSLINDLFKTVVGYTSRAKTATAAILSFIPSTGLWRVVTRTAAAITAAFMPHPMEAGVASLLTVGTVALSDYMSRVGLSHFVLHGISIFTPLHRGILLSAGIVGLLLFIASSFISGFNTPNYPQPTDPGNSNGPLLHEVHFDGFSEEAKANMAAAVQLSEETKAAMAETVQTIKETVDEVVSEDHSTVAAGESLSDEARARLNAVAAMATANPVVAPLQDAELPTASPEPNPEVIRSLENSGMGELVAVAQDAIAISEGRPLPRPVPPKAKQAQKATPQKTTPPKSTMRHTTRSTAK